MMNKFSICVLWLKVVSIMFALFGMVVALFNQTAIFQIAFNNHINPVFWQDSILLTETLYFQQQIYGLLGATCVMVGILAFFIVKNAFAKQEKWAWNCLFFGILAWFIIDEPISLYFHVYFNVCSLYIGTLGNFHNPGSRRRNSGNTDERCNRKLQHKQRNEQRNRQRRLRQKFPQEQKRSGCSFG